MAEIQTQIGDIFGNIFSSTINITLIIAVVVFIVLLVGGMLFYFFVYKKKFDIECKIISTRAGEDKVFFDMAAILLDKKRNVEYLKLRDLKVKLELPKFNIFYNTNRGDYCEIERYSQRGFRFLTPPFISKKYLVRKDGRIYPVANLKQYPIESDISWILARLKENKNIIDPESLLMKLLAYLPQIFSGALMFMMLFVIFKYMPDMFETMRDIIQDLRKQVEPEVIVGELIPISLWSKIQWKRKAL